MCSHRFACVCAGILLAFGAPCRCEAETSVKVTVEETHTLWKDGLFVLDVRTAAEFEGGHIPKAVNIPVAELRTRIGEIAHVKPDGILVYCASGSRSRSAAVILVDEGFSGVRDMSAGFAAWKSAGYEVAIGSEGEGEEEEETRTSCFRGNVLTRGGKGQALLDISPLVCVTVILFAIPAIRRQLAA
jgi:rhodanese-related sulfurtransferase